MPPMQIGDETFNVVVEGPENAPALILSNSLGTNLAMWDPQMPEFAKRFRVIRYDSRGHGKSVVGKPPYSIAQLGQDALAVLDALGIKRAHFCGLSKGGMVGQWLLAHAPHRLDRVVLANTGARMTPPDAWNTRIHVVRAQGMKAITPAIIERWFTPRFKRKIPPRCSASPTCWRRPRRTATSAAARQSATWTSATPPRRLSIRRS